MKFSKLVNELDKRITWVANYQRERDEKLKICHKKIKAEEKNILKKLDRKNNPTMRRKLKKNLNKVKKAYSVLGFQS